MQFYLIGSVGTAVTHIKTGRIRALGVGSSQRLPVLPDVPPIAETLPGYEARGWNGILAPARTPQAIVDRLHREIVKIVRSPEFSEVLTSEGATAVGNMNWVGAIDIREDIKRIQCPTLVIGTDTARRGRSVFEGWQKTIPNWELMILPIDGYHAAGTDPDSTARLTLDFITRHSF